MVDSQRLKAGLSRSWKVVSLTLACGVIVLAAILSGGKPPSQPLLLSSWTHWFSADPISAISLVVAALGGAAGTVIGIYQIAFDRQAEEHSAVIRKAIEDGHSDSAVRTDALALQLANIRQDMIGLQNPDWGDMAFLGNYSFIVNARGKICFVHSKKLRKDPETMIYNLTARQLEFKLQGWPSYPLQMSLNDELHECFSKIEEVLIIRMENQQPFDGWTCSLLKKEGPWEPPKNPKAFSDDYNEERDGPVELKLHTITFDQPKLS